MQLELFKEQIAIHDARVRGALVDPGAYIQRHGKQAFDDLKIKAPREKQANCAGKGKGKGHGKNGGAGSGKGYQNWSGSSSNAITWNSNYSERENPNYASLADNTGGR